jgi:Galactose oxidase, central domain
MTFSASGFLDGIPTAVATYNVVFTVTDSQSPAVQATANLSLNVQYPLPPRIFTSPAPPAGGANLPYSFTFTASGTAPLTWTETGALPSGLTVASGLLSGTPTATGSFPITLEVQDRYGQNSPPQNFTILFFPHGFVATGTMGTARQHHTATLLQNGKVLVAGGADSNGNATATAELYDPANGTFTPTSGNMTVARSSHTATLLTNGKVLIAGGTGTGTTTPTAELFDPATGTFTATGGAMTAVRTSHTATLLTNGQVLLADGTDATSAAHQTAELFDPASGTFTATTGKMGTARFAQTAASLSSGKVLVAGGLDATGVPTMTAEVFDPSAGTFTATTGNMTIARAYHTATFLPGSGKVLLAGGEDATGAPGTTAELFDPTAGTFTATASPMMTARNRHNANLLTDGTVLLLGGEASVPSLAEIFNPSSSSFSQTGSMTRQRSVAASVLPTNGKVLVTGGADVLGTSTATAELYQ